MKIFLLKPHKAIKLNPNQNQKPKMSLLDKGKEIAEKIYERHKILTEVLIEIGVSPEVATDDACKIEHHISDESFNAIKNKFNK